MYREICTCPKVGRKPRAYSKLAHLHFPTPLVQSGLADEHCLKEILEISTTYTEH